MKRFLIPATLLLILLTAWGCGNTDNIFSPEADTEVFAAPKDERSSRDEKHGEAWIGPEGGILNVQGTQIIFPQGALDNEVYIKVNITIDHKENEDTLYFWSPRHLF